MSVYKGGPFNIDAVAYLATAIDCYQYAEKHMRGLPRFANREELLAYAIENVTLDGSILEFGVFSGHSINLIADKFPSRQVYGFDSFQGLPETWTPGAPAGHFAVKELPKVLSNVELVVGWFDRSLPAWVERHPQEIALLHVDCDLYSSTQTVLAQLHKQIVPGTIIVFDEYFNYPEWRRHEYLAFQEFVHYHQIQYRYIGLVPEFEHVAVKIIG